MATRQSKVDNFGDQVLEMPTDGNKTKEDNSSKLASKNRIARLIEEEK